MDEDNSGYLEASVTGFGLGAILGGLVAGGVADVLKAPVHPMLAYFVGGVLGALAGAVAGRVAVKKLGI